MKRILARERNADSCFSSHAFYCTSKAQPFLHLACTLIAQRELTGDSSCCSSCGLICLCWAICYPSASVQCFTTLSTPTSSLWHCSDLRYSHTNHNFYDSP